MTHYLSPVPLPAPDAAPAEIYREIYGMPAFLTVPCGDLAASADFWLRGLGFVELFAIPGRVVHLRRWAFQDVLLVPGEPAATPARASISFACVLSQLDEAAARCEELLPGCAGKPEEKPWNSVELTVITPENTRVVLTAARPIDPAGPSAAWLREGGIEVPEE
jgi:hypothetical protein